MGFESLAQENNTESLLNKLKLGVKNGDIDGGLDELFKNLKGELSVFICQSGPEMLIIGNQPGHLISKKVG